MGLVLEYFTTYSSVSAGGESTSGLAHVIGTSLYYTGRKNLQVGLGGAMQLGLEPIDGVDAMGQPAKSGSPSVYYIQFILRYIW
jgi:hypothetical protein